MNIVILTHSGKTVTRPETSRKKEDLDIYLPDFIDSVSASRTLFVKIDRPGRSIQEKFASRYFTSWCNGLLLYAENLIDGSEEGFACASCADSLSLIPYTFKSTDELEDGLKTLAGKAIAECSRWCFLRTGDFVGIEMEERKPLCSRTDGRFETETDNYKCAIIF